MSKPIIKSGPATGVQTSELKNEVLSDNRYTGASTPGTANEAYPQHVENGPGHEDCNE